MVTADLEVCAFTDGYPCGSDFQKKYAALGLQSAVTIDSPLGGLSGARKLKYEMISQFFWQHMSSHSEKYVTT